MLCLLVLVTTILGTISIPSAVVQVLVAAAAQAPNTHLFLPRLLRLWGLAVSRQNIRIKQWSSFKIGRLTKSLSYSIAILE